MTQKALAKLIGSTQARVAKAETGTVEVSLDLMFRAFFAAGGTLEDLVVPKAKQPTEVEVVLVNPVVPGQAKRLAKRSG